MKVKQQVDSFNKYILAISFLYVFSFILLAFIRTDKFPPAELVFIQFILLSGFVLSFIFFQRFTVQASFFLIISYQILLSISMCFFFLWIKEPFGYNAVDAFWYYDINIHTIGKSFDEFLNYMGSIDADISDYGFPFIRYFIFNFAGNLNLGIIFIVLLNCLSIGIGSYFLYKLSCNFLSIKLSFIVGLLWGLNSCSIYSNVSGLKESIFTTLIIISFYYMYKYRKNHNLLNLLLFILFCLSTIFFRIYIAAFILLIFVFRSLYNRMIKYIPIFLIVLWAIATFTLILFSEEWRIITQFAVNQEATTNTFELLQNSIMAFIAPLPNYLLMRISS